jgi:hypothetical protein
MSMIMGTIDENFMFGNGIPSDDEKQTNKGGVLTRRKSMLAGTMDAEAVEVLNY